MRRLTSLVLLCLLVGSGCGGSTVEPFFYSSGGSSTVWSAPDPAQSSTELQALVDKAMGDNQIPGAVVGVWTPTGSWTSATGEADVLTRRGASLSDFSAWRSITKSLTVTIVLQLVAEGRLGLDEPVASYVSGVPNGERITIRQLANMTSGLFNYSSDEDFLNDFVADLSRAYTVDELLAYAFVHPVNFQAGTGYEYSNTNTILLQKVAETVTRQSLEQLFRARLFSRLPAGSVEYLTGTTLPDPHLNGYIFDQESRSFEEYELNGTSLAGAGAMVGTLEGLRDWGRLLVGGDLLPGGLQAQRFLGRRPTNGPLYDSYGLGMGEIGGWWGHTGNGLGYQACVFTEPSTLSSIVILVNATNQEPDVPAKLAREIQGVLGWRR